MGKEHRAVSLLCVIIFSFIGALFSGSLRAQDSSALKEAEVANVPTGSPYQGNLLVFSDPSLESTKIGFINNGDSVKILQMSGFFSKVIHAKFPEGGWVPTQYLKMKESTETISSPGKEPLLTKYINDCLGNAPSPDPIKFKRVAPKANLGILNTLMKKFLLLGAENAVEGSSGTARTTSGEKEK
ncbi:MAG: SH3 domain-containing protein [Candidatus Ozemobacteraceae bacterium]